MKLTLSAALVAATTAIAAAHVDSAPVAPAQKLSYQECVDIGSSISVMEGEIEDLKRRIAEEAVPARRQQLSSRMNTLDGEVDNLKLRQYMCIGVTIDQAPKRNPTQSGQRGGIGAQTESFSTPAPQAGRTLPYAECVELGSEIAVTQGKLDSLANADTRTAARAAAVRNEMSALNSQLRSLKAQEQAGCRGVTLDRDGKADASDKPVYTPPDRPMDKPAVSSGDGINPLCKERVDILNSLRNASGDDSLSAIRKSIIDISDEIRTRGALLLGDLSAEQRADVERRVQAAQSRLAAKQAEETAITGRMDRLRQELESLGCDPVTGKTTNAPPPGRGEGGRTGRAAGGGRGGVTDPNNRTRDTRFTGEFALWVEWAVGLPQEEIGTLVLRDIYQDRGHEKATVKMTDYKALVDLSACGQGPTGARTPHPAMEYYEGEIRWKPNRFLTELNRRPSPATTPMEDARVLACDTFNGGIAVLFSGTERRGGYFNLVRPNANGQILGERITFEGRRSAKLFVIPK